MGYIKHKRFRQLESACDPIELTDPLPEAGWKIVAKCMLNLINATADYADDDKSSLSTMQDTARRAHHVFMILDDYYTSKTRKQLRKPLAKLVQRIAAVVQLRQLSLDMARSDAPNEDEFMEIAAQLAQAESKLDAWLHSKKYRKLVKRASKFARKPGRGNRKRDTASQPIEVRHLAPLLLHEQLANVRRYDTAVDALHEEDLLSLYVDVLYLQDVITYFHDLLGASIEHVEEKIARLRDPLATISQIAFARQTFIEEDSDYLEELDAQAAQALAALPDTWASFNTRTNLRKFADALLVLR